MKTLKLLLVNVLIFVILASPALSQGNETPNQTAAPTVVATTVAPTAAATPAATTAASTVVATPVPTAAAPGKFRVGPSVTLRPVTDVIETNQDGIAELFMNNPSLNDVTLNVDVRISVPSGIHVYGQSFGEAAGAGVVAGTFSVPAGSSRTIAVVIKADKSARIGSHTLSFTGLYWPGDNKDAFQPLSLTYPVTVKEPSKNPESAEPSNPKAVPAGAETPKVQIPGFGALLAIFGVFAIARLLSRKT
ncbi:MAG: PGF-CTERM sorting domain-containing protein [Candidatus Methanoperedens sp.]|nr:PGF-CTERM sorting domain-containing protein [Candidatus Methanoperedens sp.]